MADIESLVLDGLALNASGLTLEELRMPTPGRRTEWVASPDADGALLLRESLFDTREITLRLRVDRQATMNDALTRVEALSKKLQECEKTDGGLALVWTPADATRSMTFYVLSGQITDVPVTPTGDDAGWFAQTPVMSVVLTCRPFGYGPEQTVAAVSSTAPVVTLQIPGVPGDVAAEGRLIVTDAATQARRHVEWGLQQRYYDAATSLLADSDSFVTTGFAGAQATRAGAYDPDGTGNSVVRATLGPRAVAVCSTGPLAHVGTYLVKARVFATGEPPRLRLAWRAADNALTSNPLVTPALADAFCEVDLGYVVVPAATIGAQSWEGQIHAESDVAGDLLDIDVLTLIPVAEGYGKARASYAYSPGVLVARDEFTATTAGAALNGRVAPQGGTWATSGAATDFAAADAPAAGESQTRATTGDTARRLAVLSGALTDTEVSVRVQFTNLSWAYDTGDEGGVIARYVDASNYMWAGLRGLNEDMRLSIRTLVAGVESMPATKNLTLAGIVPDANRWYTIRLIAFASGTLICDLLDDAGKTVATVKATSTSAAAGGALASGRAGMLDRSASATTRYYDEFYAATPAAEPIVVHAGQSIEFRHDDVLRENAAGTIYGRPASYRGAPFRLPAAGDKNRPSRLLVKARRADVDGDADSQIADNTTVEVRYRPRYLVVPGA